MSLVNPFWYGVGGGGTPSGIADIWMWGEPSREIGLVNNDPMPQLTDQTGNTRHFVQGTGGEEPLYKTNILNGLACARGEGNTSGTPYHWDGPDMSSLTAAHIFCVVICDTEGGTTLDNGLWHFGTSGASNHYPYSDNSIYDGTLSTTRQTVGDPSPALTSWRLVEVISTSSEWTFKLDGTQLFTTGTNTVAGSATPRLLRNAASGGDSLKGYFGGIYIFSAKKTGTDRDTTLIGYLNTRFNQTWT